VRRAGGHSKQSFPERGSTTARHRKPPARKYHRLRDIGQPEGRREAKRADTDEKRAALGVTRGEENLIELDQQKLAEQRASHLLDLAESDNATIAQYSAQRGAVARPRIHDSADEIARMNRSGRSNPENGRSPN